MQNLFQSVVNFFLVCQHPKLVVVEALNQFGPCIPHMWRSLETHVNLIWRLLKLNFVLIDLLGIKIALQGE
jgi:hypothetical protein